MAKMQLSSAFDGASGKMDGFSVVAGRGGLVIRRKPVYRRPTSPDQALAATRMTLASAAWNQLTPAQAQAWNAYAQTLTHHNRLTRQPYHPTGINVFIALATKLLQITPGATIPLNPPSGPFGADDITVSVSAPPANLPTDAGAIQFIATGNNRAGTLTELLIQTLKTPRRTPTSQYKSAAFTSFSSAHRIHSIPLPSGTYACAYRFVEPTTGRQTPLIPLGIVSV